jgi:NAD dependent epimerase/dehydratase
MRKKVLVTGADGFIGSHLTERLVRLGYDVRAFVMYNSFNSWGWLDSCAPDIKGNFEVMAGDIRDPFVMRKAVTTCDYVMHLAALIAIPYSYSAPNAYVDTNINGTLNILQSCKEAGVEKVVHTSTSEVYGSAKYVPIDEIHPLVGQSPYSATKISADQLAYSYFSSFNLPITIARPFNTYGPRQSARAVIPTVITQLLTGKNTIRLGQLSPTRDFNYISDTVDAFIALMNSEAGLGEVFNFGSGFEISIQDLVSLIGELMDIQIIIETDENRIRPENSEVQRLCSDISKIKKIIGWAPNIDGKLGLETGLKKTIAWFSEKENLKLYKTNIYNI